MNDEDVFEATFEVATMTHEVVTRNGFGERHVYGCVCEDVATRWITMHEWDGKLRFVEGAFWDSRGGEVIVVEEDDDEYGEWS